MNLKQVLKKAQKEKYAIGQFNFSTLDQMRGILRASSEMKTPVILGTSEGELNYLGLRQVVALIEIARTEVSVPIFLNLDHGKDLDLIKEAIDYGFSAVHFDGSDLPLEKNIEYAKKIVEYAKKKNVLVEGELGYITGGSKLHKKKAKIKKENLTSPENVQRFIKETKVDSLAISIGNLHGVYLGMPDLDFERLRNINNKTNASLVLHGGSGISKKEIKKAIGLGIVKININTELRIAWKKSLIKNLNSKKIKPYNILSLVEKDIQKKVEEKIKLFHP